MSENEAQINKSKVLPDSNENTTSILNPFKDKNNSLQSNYFLLDKADINTIDPDIGQCLCQINKSVDDTKCQALLDFMVIIEVYYTVSPESLSQKYSDNYTKDN